MTDKEILNQLLKGEHLNDAELKRAESLVHSITNELKSRQSPESKIELTQVKHDSNGNPRYVVHFLTIDNDYLTAINKAREIGGTKYRGKDFGGGIVFQSYNTANLKKMIVELKNQ